jgi:hypothetical protein
LNMAVEKFLSDYAPGTGVDENILAELSGISSQDGLKIVRHWSRWTDDEVLGLHTQLSDLAAVDSTMEFECIFKAGLDHKDSRVRAAAAHGLAETGDTVVISRILEMMETDDDVDARAAAASTISSFAMIASEGKLTERLRVRMLEALTAVLDAADASSELWRRALEAAGSFGDARINRYIARATKSDGTDLRRSVLIAMARTCDPRWLDFVTQELENSDATVRFEAVNALGEIGEEADAFYLEEPMDDQDLMVQLAAVAAAEKIGGPTAKSMLQVASQSSEPAVASAAAGALAGIANEESLVHTVTPEMASTGMYGAHMAGSDDAVPYDAGEREGWGHLSEAGESFLSPDAVHEDDDDPLASLMDYEAAPGQWEDDD